MINFTQFDIFLHYFTKVLQHLNSFYIVLLKFDLNFTRTEPTPDATLNGKVFKKEKRV